MFERICLIVTTALSVSFVFWAIGTEGVSAAASAAVSFTRTVLVTASGMRAANDGSLYEDPADEVELGGKPAAAKPTAYRPPAEVEAIGQGKNPRT